MTAPTGSSEPRQFGDAVDGLLDRHLLQQRHQVDGGLGRPDARRMTVSAWLRIGPTRASPATSALTLRKRAMRPVGGASSTTASYYGPSRPSLRRTASYGLAGEQHVAQAGRDRGGEVDGADPLEQPLRPGATL